MSCETLYPNVWFCKNLYDFLEIGGLRCINSRKKSCPYVTLARASDLTPVDIKSGEQLSSDSYVCICGLAYELFKIKRQLIRGKHY